MRFLLVNIRNQFPVIDYVFEKIQYLKSIIFCVSRLTCLTYFV
jgi:hypothetical protein